MSDLIDTLNELVDTFPTLAEAMEAAKQRATKRHGRYLVCALRDCPRFTVVRAAMRLEKHGLPICSFEDTAWDFEKHKAGIEYRCLL